MLKHIVHPLASKELIWVLDFTESIEKQGEVVVVVKLLNLNLPCNLVALGIVFQGYWEVSTLVELPEVGFALLGHRVKFFAQTSLRSHQVELLSLCWLIV